MKATREDALNLIRHWKNEDAPLRCTCASEGLGFQLTGRVAGLSDSALSIKGTACALPWCTTPLRAESFP